MEATRALGRGILLAWLGAVCGAAARAEEPHQGPSWDLSRGDLKVSSNRRFIVHADGTPFFYLGDTAWELFHRLNRQEAAQYLENRRAKGFTVVQAVALAELDGLNTSNPYGDRPLLNNNPATPDVTPGANPDNAAEYDYWDHVDYIVGLAESKGIYIGMLPTWGRWVNDGPINSSNARAYGRFIGGRYASRPNIIWILGGDRNASGFETVWREMAAGIKEGDGGRHLMTFHPPGGTSSSSWFHNDDWLDFNMWQTGHDVNIQVWNQIGGDYSRTPVKPTMNGEPLYEDHPIGFDPNRGYATAYDVRKYFYWCVFAGAHGHTYGCHNIWQMYAPGRTPISWAHAYWYDSLDFEGAWDVLHLRRLMLSRDFLSRVPDSSIVVDSLSGGDRIQATRGDGYIFIYSASGRGFTVNMGKISGAEIKAWWYNPKDGTSSAAGEYANTGQRSFTPPSSGTGNDWVLVLDDKSRNFPPPGIPSGNSYPTASITSPANGALFDAPATVQIAATAADADGSVVRVEFYAGETKLGEDASSPYAFTWSSVAVGSYVLTARAVDDKGAVGVSSPVSVLVRDPNSAFYRAINLNGNALVIDGDPWEGKDAANYSYTGNAFENQGVALSPSTDANRAAMIRSSIWNPSGSNVTVSAVPDGAYEVYLYVWEDNNPATFDIYLNGVLVRSGYNSGSAGHWDRLGPWATTVSDGSIRVTCSPGDANLSGIEIWRSGGSTPPPQNPPPSGGGILREYWLGIPGTSVGDLTSSPNFPYSPSGSGAVADFEAPIDWADNYGTRMRGYVTAPQTGQYTFWIASDDGSQLWLSSDDNPANRMLIAYVDGWTSSSEWTKYSSQQSGPIHLMAGRRYYIEALQKEGGGGDNLAVGWRLPDGTLERPIPGSRLSPADPSDSDGDGVPDADELAAGSDPWDKDSRPASGGAGGGILEGSSDSGDDRCGATGFEFVAVLGVLLLFRRR